MPIDNPPPQLAAAVCAYDQKAMLALDFDHFDQDLQGGGWRKLDARPGCEAQAADLVETYGQVNWAKLRPYQLHLLYWHEGQLLALAGRTDQAVSLLMSGVNSPDEADFADYALGTVAFLEHDLEALKAARTRLAARPEPASFAQGKAWFKAHGAQVSWPLNLNVLDGLIACFDRPYSVAYTDCRPVAMASPPTKSAKP